MKAAYDDIADWYESQFLATQRGLADDHGFSDVIGIDQALVELLGPGTGSCLEVGCGTGVYSARLRGLGREPVGVDLSAAMLRHAANRLPVAQADAGNLPLATASVLAVVAVMVHTDMPHYDTVLHEIRRVLTPGGVFVHIGVHPCFNGSFADRSAPPDVVVRPGYLNAHWVPPIGPNAGDLGRAGQVRDKVGAAHVPVHILLNWVADAGFVLERSSEGGSPTPITLSLRCSTR